MKIVLVGKPDFAGRIAERITNSLFVEVEERIFPDGEVCPRLHLLEEQDLADAHVIVVMQIDANQSKNEYLVSLLLILYNINQYNPADLTCIMPYHIYSRQDRASRLGEPVSIKYLAQALESAGMTNFLTVNSHIYGKNKLKHYFPTVSVFHISAIPVVAKEILPQVSSPEQVVCLAPDEGAILLAREAANAIKTPFYGAIHKERDPDTGDITQSLIGNAIEVQGKSVLIIDDLVSSGGTMVGAAKIAMASGASEVFFGYIHAVHSPNNFKNLLTVDAKSIISTDTIKTKIEGLSVVSIIPLISSWIKENIPAKNP